MPSRKLAALARRNVLIGLPLLALANCGRPPPARAEVRHNGLVGTLFLPHDSAARPAVVCLTGGEGGLWEAPAQSLATSGFAALALATHNYDGVPAHLRRLPIDYVEQAVDWLRARVAPQNGRVVLRGWSRGGEMALLTASMVPSVSGVIAYAPRTYVGREGNRPNNFNDPTTDAAWTFRGRALDGQPLPRAMMQDPAHPSLEDLHGIAVEAINGPIMLVSGQRDTGLDGTTATFSCDHAERRLSLFKFPFAHTHLNYAGAGHSIAGPPGFTGPVIGGGTLAADAAAIIDSWPRSLAFLEMIGRAQA